MKKYSASKYTQKKGSASAGLTLRNGKPQAAPQPKAKQQQQRQQPSKAMLKAKKEESEEEEESDDGAMDDEFGEVDDSDSDGAEADDFDEEEGDEGEDEDDEDQDDEDDDEDGKGNKRSLFEDSEEEDKGQGKAMFSDENATWLKAKKQKVTGEDEDDDDEEVDKLTAIERENIDLRKKQEKIDAEAKKEWEEHVEGEQYQLTAEAEDLSAVGERMRSIGQVLANFKERREEGKSRADYIAQLRKDIHTYYGYTDFLIDLYMCLFSTTEMLEHLEANETPRPTTIRVNTLKSRRRDLAHSLISKGVNLDPIKWSKVGLVIYDTQVPIGATAEYLSGQYMLQSAASFLPVMALNPQPNERVLDVCAAPGGKSTFIAALMKNTGALVANDVSRERLPALVGNLHRMGVQNSVVVSMDGRKLGSMGKFDRVLLDAPCMGLGVIAKDPSIKSSKYEGDLEKCSTLQKELILAAIDSVKVSDNAGILVVEENEAVVNYALARRFVEVVETGLEFGVEGMINYRGKNFDKSLKHSRRFYPQTHNVDGFYVCKIKKLADGVRMTEDQKQEKAEKQAAKAVLAEQKVAVNGNGNAQKQNGKNKKSKQKKNKQNNKQTQSNNSNNNNKQEKSKQRPNQPKSGK